MARLGGGEDNQNGGENTAQRPPSEPRRSGPPSHPNSRPNHDLPPACRMSSGAPRGLASSGQKPIAEIIHPLCAAEEPLSLGVNAVGDKVRL